MRVIYVVGAGRSGSTLLDHLLGLTHDVSSTGELHRLTIDPHIRQCSCGDPLQRCPRWGPVLAEARGDGPQLATTVATWTTRDLIVEALAARGVLSRGTFARWRDDGVARAAAGTARIAEVLTRREGTAGIVDSTKSVSRLLYLAAEPALHATYAVHLVRDPRAVAASLRRRKGLPLGDGALKWRREVRRAELLPRLVGIEHVTVRYEDLCRDPVGTCQRLMAALGLSALQRSGPPSAGTGQHLIPGSPSAFGGFDGVVLDERWKDELEPSERTQVAGLVRHEMRRLGYSG